MNPDGVAAKGAGTPAVPNQDAAGGARGGDRVVGKLIVGRTGQVDGQRIIRIGGFVVGDDVITDDTI